MNYKKISIIPITIILIFLSNTTSFAKNTLNDVENHKNQEAIEYLIENNIVQGYSDGSYKPNDSINRAEFTKIIVEATFTQDSINNCIKKEMQPNWTYVFFPDVNKNAWYAKYICVAKISGMINGYPNGNFLPEQSINKAEAIKIIITSKNYTIPKEVKNKTYSDVNNNDWYAPYIKTAMDYNLLEDTGTSALGINLTLSRAEMSEMAYRILVSANQAYKPGLRIHYGKSKKSIEEYISEKKEIEFVNKMNKKAKIKKVSTKEKKDLEKELKELTLSLIYAESNEENNNKFLESFDQPELNYINYKNKVNNQRQMEIRKISLEDGYPSSIEEIPLETLPQTAHYELLSAINNTINESDLDFYYDNEIALIGIKIKPDPKYDTTQYGLLCLPFIYDEYWKLKLNNLHLSDSLIDFSNQDAIKACKNNLLTDNPKLESKDLVKISYSISYGLSVNIFLNGHLIDHLLGAGASFDSNHYLPLKEGKNTIEIVNINPYTDSFKTENFIGSSIEDVQISIGDLTDIKFSKKDNKKTYTFNYNKSDKK